MGKQAWRRSRRSSRDLNWARDMRTKQMTVKTLQREALRIAERALTKGVWTVETAQFWLTRVEQQPEDVVRACRK